MVSGHKRHQLAVESLMRIQHLHIAQTEFLRENVITPALAAVNIRMHGIEHHVVCQGFTYHCPYPVRRDNFCDATPKNQRMVRNHQVAIVPDSFVYHLLRHLETDHRACDFLFYIAALHPAIVEILLQIKRELLF